MFNEPKDIKYKKIKKGKLVKFEYKSNKLKFGTIGLKAAEAGIVSSKQLEAARQTISRKIKRKGKIWVRIFPNLPFTAKPTGVRMGKGRGNITYWGSKVRSGTVLFEVCGMDFDSTAEALKIGGDKLPIKTRIFS